MIKRLFFLNLKFGRIVEAFFQEIFGVKKNTNYDRITLQSRQTRGKLTSQFIDVLFLNNSWTNVIFYILVSLVVFMLYLYISKVEKPMKFGYTLFKITLKMRLGFVLTLALRLTFFGFRNIYHGTLVWNFDEGIIYSLYQNFNYVIARLLCWVITIEMVYMTFSLLDIPIITERFTKMHKQVFITSEVDPEIEKGNLLIKKPDDYLEMDHPRTKFIFGLKYELMMIFYNTVTPLTPECNNILVKLYLMSSVYKLIFYQIIIVTLQYLPLLQLILILSLEVRIHENNHLDMFDAYQNLHHLPHPPSLAHS